MSYNVSINPYHISPISVSRQDLPRGSTRLLSLSRFLCHFPRSVIPCYVQLVNVFLAL